LLIWYTGIFSGVLLNSNFSKVYPGIFIGKIYSQVCHQDPARSFFIYGSKLEVCARCTGIYTGTIIFSFVAFFIPRLKPGSKEWLVLSSLVMAADVMMYSIGIYDYSKWTAFGTGLFLGSVSILYIFTGIDDYFLELRSGLNAQ
jgi:uncharacterized membrane protein